MLVSVFETRPEVEFESVELGKREAQVQRRTLLGTQLSLSTRPLIRPAVADIHAEIRFQLPAEHGERFGRIEAVLVKLFLWLYFDAQRVGIVYREKVPLY